MHWDGCIHSVPENDPSKGMSEMGEAVRYARVNKISGLIVFCSHCKPIQAITPEPRAKLGLKTTSLGCTACGGCAMAQSPGQEGVQITGIKTLASVLTKKFFGSR